MVVCPSDHEPFAKRPFDEWWVMLAVIFCALLTVVLMCTCLWCTGIVCTNVCRKKNRVDVQQNASPNVVVVDVIDVENALPKPPTAWDIKYI